MAAGCTLSLLTKTIVVLLVLICAAAVWGAEISDIRVPLDIDSRFVVGTEEGPPADRNGLCSVGPCYLLQFKSPKYKRYISFSPDGQYIYLRDYYGDYLLPRFQAEKVSSYVAFRRQYAFNRSWQSDLAQELGKNGPADNKGPVNIEIPWQPPPIVSNIIGNAKSSINVTGSRSIQFSGRSEWEDNVRNTATFKQSKFPTLQMQQKSRFKVTGSIGSKITVEVDQDSQRDVDLANTIKLRYKGDEDEILQSIEAGNTNLSLPNAQLIGYSQNVQGLFGIKTTAKVGHLDLTMITSQEKGTTEKTTFSANGQGTPHIIHDYQYLAYTYYDLDVAGMDPAFDTLMSVELYTNGSPGDDPQGIMVVNPNDSLPYVSPEEQNSGEYELGPFHRLDPTSDFELVKPGWYVVLTNPLISSRALGAYIRYFHHDPNDYQVLDTVIIGNLNYRNRYVGDTTLVLELLQSHNTSSPTYTTWNRMWRNVYDLGARDISYNGLQITIYKGAGNNANGQITDPSDQDSHCYVTLLKLDRKNDSNGSNGPDCVFDNDAHLIDFARGHLIFPDREPFDSDSLQEKVPQIYRLGRDQQRSLQDSSKYYIYVQTSQRASTFSLGKANLMPNSEVVRLGDGTVLQKDVDYTINYDIGQITLISDQARNPAANISVDYEYAPFFSAEKKSLFGIAGQYAFWDNSNITMAAMYRSESASDPRPRVGREPTKSLVWDSNFDFNFKPQFMTSLVDALPFVESDAPSSFELSGELAQSFPNPNTKNEAFIDDFEGSKSYTDLSNRRGIWTLSSPPLDSTNAPLSLSKRAKLWWYNPYDQMAQTDIWPLRAGTIKNEDNKIDVMFMHYFPDTTAAPESSWAGIMRPFFAGLADQSEMRFIEFWYFLPPDSVGFEEDPTLNFDFGSVSEDINDNELLDSEDRTASGVYGVFEPDSEDTGLDGLFDRDEPGVSPSNPDPNGDDWAWNPDVNRYDYSHINGTENNNLDPDRRGRFDTEDINNNGSLDKLNGYFEYTIHLKNPEYLVDSTTTGWRLLRIPFQDSTAYRIINNRQVAQFAAINFARIWMTGATREHLLGIASMQLVGNRWLEVPRDPLDSSWTSNEKFEVTVKNTQDNASYYSPPGVAGNLDRSTNIREKEQSLVLAYDSLAPGHTMAAYSILYNSDNYTKYARMKMYVHGDTAATSRIRDGQVTFFIRLCSDKTGQNFYEYHTVLDTGWAESNWVDIDFARMTALKYELQKIPRPDSAPPGWVPDTTDGNYRVYGNPSLSQVWTYIMGVEVNGQASQPYGGEVWVDELRVSDVRRTTDYAGRIQATARFADLFTVNATYTRTGADFTKLASDASGSTTIAKSLHVDFSPQKFFPPSLGLSLPASFSWQSNLALPRLKTSSDIILTPEAQQLEKTQSKSYGYNLSQSFSHNTSNWLWNLTLNRIRTSYTFTRSQGLSPTMPIDRRDTYRGNGAYDLTPKAKPSVKPFFWTKYLFLPAKVYNSKLFVLPTQLSFTGEVDGSKTSSVNYRGIATGTRVRDLTLGGNTAMDIFSTLHTAYSLSSNRDISKPGRFKLSVNPSKLKLGQERSFTQRFESNFQPKIVKPVDNRFTFSSTYAENSDFNANPDSTRTTQAGGTFKTDVTLNLQSLFPALGAGRQQRPKPPPVRPPNIGGGAQPGDTTGQDLRPQQPDEQTNGGPSFGSPKWVWRRFIGLLRTIQPIRGSYTKDRKLNLRGLTARPSWQYLFGFAENPNVPIKNTTGLSGPSQSVYSDDYELNSGLQPGRGLTINGGYSLRNSITRSSNDPTYAKSISFPDLSISLQGLEKIFIFRKFASSVSLTSAYTKKTDDNGRADTHLLLTRNISKQWAPLAGLAFNFPGNLKASVTYNLSKVSTVNTGGNGLSNRNTFAKENSIKFSFNYSFTAPQGMKLPLLKRIKFNSQLTMSLDITLNNTKTEAVTGDISSISANTSHIVIEPRLTYQFSRAITGGLHARWDDSSDKILNRKHHIRELGINAEIRF
jgi:cell surface protein SprA